MYGFDTADVQESEKALAVLTTDKLNTDEHASKIDGSKAPEPSNAQSNEVENVIISKDRPTEIVANLDDEKAAFIQNAIDKGFQHIADDAVDGKYSGKTLLIIMRMMIFCNINVVLSQVHIPT